MDATQLLTLWLGAEDSAAQRAILDKHRSPIGQKTLEEWKSLAHEHAYAGDEQQAKSIAHLILTIGEWSGEESIIALGEWTYGNIYTILGRGKDAQPHYQAAERIYRAVGDELNLARMSVGVVGYLYHTSEYEKACQLAEEIRPILAASEDSSDARRLASVANNLANVYDHLGRYEEALELYEQKLGLWEQWSDHPRAPAEIARTQINLGIVKKRLNLWSEAELALEAGRRLLSDPKRKDAHRLDLARAEMQLADLLTQRGAPADTVMTAFIRAQAARDALSDSSQKIPPDLLFLDLFEARWQLQSGNVTTDLSDRLVALRDKSTAVGQVRQTLWANLLLAEYYANQGDVPVAAAHCTTVRETAQASADWEMVYRAWHCLGRVHEQAGNYELATEAFRSAVKVIEGTGRSVVSGDLRSGFLEDKLNVYQDLVGLYLGQRDWEGALHWSERARAREVVEMLTEDEVSWPTQPQTRPWLERLAQARQELATATDPQQCRSLETRIVDLSRRIAALEPRSRDWLTGETAPPADLCAALSPGTLLLIFTMTQNVLWVLPLSRDGILSPRSLGPVPAAEVVERDLDWLRNLSHLPSSLIERHAQALTTSARRPLTAWYDQLLSPLSNLLARHQKLILSPDGPLFRLPFHALYNSETDRYLIETHQVSYAPSATAWLLASQTQACGQGGLALAYAGERLHHTEAEVQAILEACPDFAAYTGQEAKSDHLQGALAEQAAFIHLAAHAVFRGDNPLFSCMQLADRRLETLDVLRLRLNARLVALSACETGRGLLRGGEYLGLARAFILAGAQTVLVSHWAVNDAATAELMGAFYRELAMGAEPPAALRQAQLTALSSSAPHHRHPYYWAPFFVLGAGGDNELGPNSV